MKKNEITVLKGIRKKNRHTVRIDGVKEPCYSKKQLKRAYPGGYRIPHETIGKKNGNELPSAVLAFGEREFPVYNKKYFNRLVYSEAGYVRYQAPSPCFTAVLKNVLWFRILLLLTAFALIFGGLYAAFSMQDAAPEAMLELEPGAVDFHESLPDAENTLSAPGIRIPGYKDITVEAEKSEISVRFVNPLENPCYMVMRLVLADTGEVLYESKLVAPGKALYKIPVSRPLEKGAYHAQLIYEPYDLQTGTVRYNGAVVSFCLTAV